MCHRRDRGAHTRRCGTITLVCVSGSRMRRVGPRRSGSPPSGAPQGMGRPMSKAPAGLDRGSLGTAGMSFFTISASAPMTVLAGSVVATFAATGVKGVPLSFLVLAVALWPFTVAYTTMSRHVSQPACSMRTSPAAWAACGVSRVGWSPWSATTRSRSACTGCSARVSKGCCRRPASRGGRGRASPGRRSRRWASCTSTSTPGSWRYC